MKKSLLAVTAAALVALSGVASAQMMTGTIASIDGGLQVIRLENGAEFKLGTFNTTSDFKVGDRVRIDRRGYEQSYMLADRVWIVSRKQSSRTQ